MTPNDRTTTTQAVASQTRQYIVGKTTGPVPQDQMPIDLSTVAQALHTDPVCNVKKTLAPRGMIGTLSAGSAEVSVIVAEMPSDRAAALQQHPQLIVETDEPLSLPAAGVDSTFKDPGVLGPATAGATFAFEVRDETGAPVGDANIYVYGSSLPAQGITDATGKATVVLFQASTLVRGLYVKPARDHWSLWVNQPALRIDAVNTVVLRPLGREADDFPTKQMLGWGQRAMRLDEVPPELRGRGVKVAVIDSGAAISHRDLRGRVAGGLDVPTGSSDLWSDDTVFHGTHCCGVIGGADNAVGIKGFVPDAEIRAVKIFPGGRFSDLLEALDYCIENQIDVANLSLGTDQKSELVEQKLAQARDVGVACIVAAGNSAGPVQYPASSPEVLAVSAIGKVGEFPIDSYHVTQMLSGQESPDGYFAASFSCFGEEVDVCGPGVAVISSVPPDGYAAWDGTSMAAPHIAGLAALVLAHHPDFQDRFVNRDRKRVDRLFEILKSSARKIEIADASRVGSGLPDAVAALSARPTAAPSSSRMATLSSAIAEAGLFRPTERMGAGPIADPRSRAGASFRELAELLGEQGLRVASTEPASPAKSVGAGVGMPPTPKDSLNELQRQLEDLAIV